MRRWVAKLVVATGWGVLGLAVAMPLAGVVWSLLDPRDVSTEKIGFPVWWRLLARSVVLALLAGLGALMLAIGPAWWLGTCRRSTRPFWLGLILAPLLMPPQVYGYAWSLTDIAGGVGTEWASVVRAGLISAGWLWPIPALVLASAWRTTGREVMSLALLDTSAGQAFWRVVLPTLRHAMIGGGCVVFAVGMLEYPIPHFLLAHVYATELLVLVNVNAPDGQIIRSAMPGILVVITAVGVAWWHLVFVRDWSQQTEETQVEAALRWTRGGQISIWALRGLAATAWIATVGVPVRLMLRRFRRPGVWTEAFTTFVREWWVSLGVSVATGVLACAVVVATLMVRRASFSAAGQWIGRLGALGQAVPALLPPVVVGIGFVKAYNSLGVLWSYYEVLRSYYEILESYIPILSVGVWVFALTARYGAVALVIFLLAWGRHADEEIDQARVDGADLWSVLGYVLLPRMRRPLAAAGLIVALLAMFEVVITQLVGPIRYQSIAISLLNHMHYGRDDVVIAICLVIMGVGVVMMQVCGWLLGARDED